MNENTKIKLESILAFIFAGIVFCILLKTMSMHGTKYSVASIGYTISIIEAIATGITRLKVLL